MEKSIRYNGHTAQPSDYETPDGDLALSLGLIHEDESLRPILPPQPLFNVPAGYEVAYIHKTTSFTHYILLAHSGSDYFAYWVDGELAEESSYHPYNYASADIHQIEDYSYDSSGDTDVPKVIGIGNTLVFYGLNNMTYVLWKAGEYKYLGTHLPEVDIRFGLLGRPRFYSVQNGSQFDIVWPNNISKADLINREKFKDNNKTAITQCVMGYLSKFIADTTVNHGRHCFPFFVRYALRLYDGSLTMQSAPILMNPCTYGGPIVTWSVTSSPDNYKDAKGDIMLMASSLTYNYQDGGDLEDWTDIVKSIDIFISKPLYTYDQDGQIESFSTVTQKNDKFSQKYIGKLYAHREDGQIEFVSTPEKSRLIAPISDGSAQSGNCAEYIVNSYSEWSYEEIYKMYFSRNLPTGSYASTIELPQFEADSLIRNIENESSYYLLESLDVETLLSSQTEGDVEIVTANDYLPSLLSREVLPDDYQSHDAVVPNNSFVYNNRLNISDIRKGLFDGFRAEYQLARCEYYHTFAQGGENVSANQLTITFDFNGTHRPRPITLYTYINEGDAEYIVKAEGQTDYPLHPFFSIESSGNYTNFSSACWFFYPNNNATKIVLEQDGWFYNIKLKQHPMLNGAYAMLEYASQRVGEQMDTPTTTSKIVDVPNKIYTSEVNNPFYFPLLGINTVGSGRILGLASATKALSQGQFGQFPLYAFTTDGVWALEVASNGSYSARQPVTRDVCISMDSITQLDSSVVFATDRGLMMLQGSDALSITDDINLEDEVNLSTLLRGLSSVCDSSLTSALTIIPLHDFISNCRLMYDYTHQHIVVYNPNKTYAYVFSLKSKKWGMMYSTLKKTLNSYPDAICVEASGQNDVVMNYSKTNVTASTALPFVVVSRPIKFDMNDVMKTVDTIIQRGVFRRGDVKTLLYGSRDMYHWNLVYTSNDHYLRGFRGTPYKYFRIALVGALTKEERIFGCEASFTPRLVDQLR